MIGRNASLLAVAAVLTLSGCGSLRGERVMVSEDGVVYDAAVAEPDATTSPAGGAVATVPAPVVQVAPDEPTATAMSFEVDLLDGGSTSGAELSANGPIHIVFVQPTCPFSLEEAPKLAAAAERHPDVTYVVAHSGGTPADYRSVIEAAGLDAANIVHVDDGGQLLWNRFGVAATPSSILVDGDGLLRSAYGALGDSGLDRAADNLRSGF